MNLITKEKEKGEGLTVGEVIEFLNHCPKEAKLLLNHYSNITWADDEAGHESQHKAWIFDTISEMQCETIDDKERYPNYKSDDKIVWLTHQYG